MTDTIPEGRPAEEAKSSVTITGTAQEIANQLRKHLVYLAQVGVHPQTTPKTPRAPLVKRLTWWTDPEDGSRLADSPLGKFSVHEDDGWHCMIDGHEDGWVKYSPAPAHDPEDSHGFDTVEQAMAECQRHLDVTLGPWVAFDHDGIPGTTEQVDSVWLAQLREEYVHYGARCIALGKELTKERTAREVQQRNIRFNWEAMVAFRDTINEHITMPSLEIDLSRGPEDNVFFEVVAKAIVDRLDTMGVQIAAQAAEILALSEHAKKAMDYRTTNRRMNRRLQLLEGWWQRKVARAEEQASCLRSILSAKSAKERHDGLADLEAEAYRRGFAQAELQYAYKAANRLAETDPLRAVVRRAAEAEEILSGRRPSANEPGSPEDLCEDEGCDHYGTPHVCVNRAPHDPQNPQAAMPVTPPPPKPKN